MGRPIKGTVTVVLPDLSEWTMVRHIPGDAALAAGDTGRILMIGQMLDALRNEAQQKYNSTWETMIFTVEHGADGQPIPF